MISMMLASLTSGFMATLTVSEPQLDTERLDTERLDTERLDTEQLNEPTRLREENPPTEENPQTEETTEEPAVTRPYDPLRPYTTCPSDLETLTALLIRDVPTYANRVLHRATAVLPDAEETDAEGKDDADIGNLLIREPYRPAFIIIAGRPELEPLDLGDYALTTDETAGGPLAQLFFTTLSRQYSNSGASEIQSYHWLFLAEAEDGWWLAFMYSRIDDPTTPRAPTAPRESSGGSVGQAVQLWLKDCRSGAIAPLE